MVYLVLIVLSIVVIVVDFDVVLRRFSCIWPYMTIFAKRNSELSRGQSLYELIINQNINSNFINIPEYKFYDQLFIRINEASKKLGASLVRPLSVIKRSLLKDIAFEKKVQDFYFQTNIQFIIMMIICWFFTFYSISLLSLSPNYFLISVLCGWQIFGVISFSGLFLKKKKRVLNGFTPVYLNFLTYQSLLSVSMPVVSIRNICNFNALSKVELSELDFYVRRFFSLVKLREQYGKATEDDLDLLMDDLNGLYEVTLSKLLVQLNIFKFIWLCVFFLSTYLISVYTSLVSALI